MATLTVDRPRHVQRSLLDPHEEALPARRPLTRRPDPVRAAPAAAPVPDAAPRPAAEPSGLTFDDLVTGAWEALTTSHAATCLVCGTALTPRFGAGPRPVAAACGSCGTELS